MQEEWDKDQEAQRPDMDIIEEIDPNDYEVVNVYNGELNKMNFNLVKSSRAFTIEEPNYWDEDLSMDSTHASTIAEVIACNPSITSKKSEDGWG